jgi:tRNA-dihydrouridine synthase B
MEKIKIGSLELKNRFLLAPMLEPNDIAFRILCKKAGCALAYVGMTSPLSKKRIILKDKPAVQLFGNSEKGIGEFIKKYDKDVSLWDFNLGCPSKLSGRLHHGAFMHKEIELIEKILKIIKDSTKKPVTIKLRKSKNAIQIAKISEKYVDAIAIHPREISQGYSGKPDYSFALKIKKIVYVPIIYSGDVDEKNYFNILNDFDFVFIGRNAIGNPNLFSKITGSRVNFTFFDYLDLAKRYDLPFRQIKMQAMNFTKGLKNAKEVRKKLIKIKTLRELETNKYLLFS